MLILHVEAFLFSIIILTITPGVDTALVIKNASRDGVKAGLFTSVGICTGLFFHAALSALGIALLLLHSPQLFQSIQIAGAFYLLYIGVQGVRKSLNKGAISDIETISLVPINQLKNFREGLLSNLLNPKTALFYLAFLPQFINPAYSAFAQSMLMAGFHFVIAMCWQSCLSKLIVMMQRHLSNTRKIQLIMQRLTGSALIFLALNLLLER